MLPRYFIVLIIIVLSSSIANAQESEWWKDNRVYSLSDTQKWDKWDKSLFASFVITDAIDCLQTRYILNSPDHYEKNPIIKNAGKTKATMYFVATGILSYFVADHLKPKPRKIFLTALNVLEISCVNHNYRAGVKLRF